MNPEITKENCLDLIDRLADKSLTFGCLVSVSEKALENLRSKDKRAGFAKNLWIVSDVEGENARLKNYYDSELDFGTWAGFGLLKELGHPILKGSLAKMITKKYRDEEFPDCPEITLGSWENSLATMLLYRWGRCEKDGEDKSLQSILSEAVWEVQVMSDFNTGFSREFVIKQKPIRDLFTLLLQLFPKP